MRRREDWAARLVAYVEEQRRAPFRWGVSDCALFAAGGVLAMTGIDAMPEYRRRRGPVRYTTERGALLALRRRDGTLTAAMTRRFGAAVDWRRARRGDVVLRKTDDALGEALGLCLGLDCAFRDPAAGLVAVKTADIAAAWRVGD